MYIELFGYVIEINIKRVDLFGKPPTLWPKRNQRALAQHIEEITLVGGFVNASGEWSKCGDNFIDRIKVCRWLLRDETGKIYMLRESKEFVELAFANHGRSSKIIL